MKTGVVSRAVERFDPASSSRVFNIRFRVDGTDYGTTYPVSAEGEHMEKVQAQLESAKVEAWSDLLGHEVAFYEDRRFRVSSNLY